MTNQETIAKEIRDSASRNFLLMLPTGYGKTNLSFTLFDKLSNNGKILIVIPKLPIIDSWKFELKKFDKEQYLKNITFTTYLSLHKYSTTEYELIIFDEAHHLTQRCREILLKMKSVYKIFLSATLKKELKAWLTTTYPKINIITETIKNAIDDKILPDPNVILIPLSLDYSVSNQIIQKTCKKSNQWINCTYKDRWKFINKYNCNISCTQYQYYLELSNTINYYKKRAFTNKFLENRWLKLCNDRLVWLANQKIELIKSLSKHLKDYRTLTFCSNINQSEQIGKNCINSKNKTSVKILNDFNNKKIKHILAVGILDEGVNLIDCRIGIFAHINSSDRLTIQRHGRILRHKKPILIIPYFVNTREEEIVKQMLNNYNPELIQTITDIKNIKL